MTDLKLCKDCKHYKRDWSAHLTGFGDTLDTCHNPALSENLVTGKSKGGRFCDFLRKEWGKCGIEGKYFEENYPSHCCQKCGEQIGWLGRFFNFFIPNHHRCVK